MSAVEEKPGQKDLSIEVVVQSITPPVDEDEEFFPDGGLRAWLVVVGCFVVSAVVIGFWCVLRFYVSES